jgi:hypothetical protein
VTTHTLSFPRTPIEVTPTDLIALNAYSVSWKKREDGRSASGWTTDEGCVLVDAGRGGATLAIARDAPTWYRRPSGEKIVMWRS